MGCFFAHLPTMVADCFLCLKGQKAKLTSISNRVSNVALPFIESFTSKQ